MYINIRDLEMFTRNQNALGSGSIIQGPQENRLEKYAVLDLLETVVHIHTKPEGFIIPL